MHHQTVGLIVIGVGALDLVLMGAIAVRTRKPGLALVGLVVGLSTLVVGGLLWAGRLGGG